MTDILAVREPCSSRGEMHMVLILRTAPNPPERAPSLRRIDAGNTPRELVEGRESMEINVNASPDGLVKDRSKCVIELQAAGPRSHIWAEVGYAQS